MRVRRYLVTLPERIVRSVLGISAGVAREAGQVAIPAGVRRGRLYQNLVETTLRFLIEQVGGAEQVYPDEERLTAGFLARRTAGNAIEALGIVAFKASPVWILAALADLSGLGRVLIPEIAASLAAQGLIDPDRTDRIDSVDALLDGLERTSGRLASTFNTPPLDVASLRSEWEALREEARGLQPSRLPSGEIVRDTWLQLQAEAARQRRSVFETSSMLAVAAVQNAPDHIRWLSRSAVVSARRTGEVLAGAVLDHYRETLGDMRRTGFVAYAGRQLRPYLRAAGNQFSPSRLTVTERLLPRSWTSRELP